VKVMNMKIDKAILLASIALAVSLISLGLQFLPQNVVPSLSQNTHMWREIAFFEGSGNTTTGTFYVPSYFWDVQIRQEEKDPQKPGRLSAYIYSPGVIEKAENAFYPFSYGKTYERFYGSGHENFYFKVMATIEIEIWNITVRAWS
jgi:hypothetical protein